MSYVALRQHRYAAADPVDDLVQRHVALVRRLAWHVHGRVSASEELEELIQIGMVALVEAARGYEDRGFEFATYASMRIKGAMIDQLRRSAGQSRNAAASRRAIEQARREVEQRVHRTASAAEIAAALDMPVGDYLAMESDSAAVGRESIDDAYSENDLAFRADGPQPDAMLEEVDIMQRVRAALDRLDERGRLVLQLYFFEEMNLEEIGHVLDVGAARVCQIKKAALDKLKRESGLSLN